MDGVIDGVIVIVGVGVNDGVLVGDIEIDGVIDGVIVIVGVGVNDGVLVGDIEIDGVIDGAGGDNIFLISIKMGSILPVLSFNKNLLSITRYLSPVVRFLK